MSNTLLTLVHHSALDGSGRTCESVKLRAPHISNACGSVRVLHENGGIYNAIEEASQDLSELRA